MESYENLEGKIVKKIMANSPNISEENASRQASAIIQHCLPELKQNIMEWAEDKPLTDIEIGDLTINEIVREWGLGGLNGKAEIDDFMLFCILQLLSEYKASYSEKSLSKQCVLNFYNKFFGFDDLSDSFIPPDLVE